jgi:hypothetical protein
MRPTPGSRMLLSVIGGPAERTAQLRELEARADELLWSPARSTLARPM